MFGKWGYYFEPNDVKGKIGLLGKNLKIINSKKVK